MSAAKRLRNQGPPKFKLELIGAFQTNHLDDVIERDVAELDWDDQIPELINPGLPPEQINSVLGLSYLGYVPTCALSSINTQLGPITSTSTITAVGKKLSALAKLKTAYAARRGGNQQRAAF